MRYLIDGCYGDGNVGDEALLRAVCGLIRHVDLDAQFRVLSSCPTATVAAHGLDAFQRVNPIGRSIYGAIWKGQLNQLLRAIRWCDCFVLGGGELFRDDVGLRASLGMFYPLLLARAMRRRVVALGVGAQTPTTDVGRLLLAWSLDSTDGVVFRDVESLEVARRMGTRARNLLWAPDMVFSAVASEFQGEPDKAGCSSPIRVVLALKNLSTRIMATEERDKLLQIIVQELSLFACSGDVVVDVVAFADADVQLSVSAETKLREHGLPATAELSCDIDLLCAIIRRSAFTVAMPLHASIFSFALGVPAIGIAYDRKINRLYRQLNLDAYCIRASADEVVGASSLMHRLMQLRLPLRMHLSHELIRMREAIRRAARGALAWSSTAPIRSSFRVDRGV